MNRVWVAALWALVFVGGASVVPAETEGLPAAKTLFFDRKYAEARAAWEAVRARARGAEAVAAQYWIARCSENLGEHERAFGEYGEFLARRPGDRALAEEARTSRVSLAARLYKAGKKQHLGVLSDALADPSKTVRYYAALQLSTLGPEAGRPAVPVLRRIVEEEADQDLVDRAKLALLRLEPGALARGDARRELPRAPGRLAHWMRIRIHKPGQARPEVSINLPLALAELLFKSLPDDVKAELRQEGYDADNFWEKLRELGPTDIISIEGDEGETIRIWTE